MLLSFLRPSALSLRISAATAVAAWDIFETLVSYSYELWTYPLYIQRGFSVRISVIRAAKRR